MTRRIGILDYGAGNLRSIINAITHVGGLPELVSSPEAMSGYDQLLLPGVGSFRRAMEQLKSRGFDQALDELVGKRQMPILGICLGMQLLGQRSSEDGETPGLGLIGCQVDRFGFDHAEYPHLKVPHVGFDTVQICPDTRLFAGVGEQADFYFTHSYRMHCNSAEGMAASCWHGEPFVAAIENDNVAGTQFHPEKSQANGLAVLKNFIDRF